MKKTTYITLLALCIFFTTAYSLSAENNRISDGNQKSPESRASDQNEQKDFPNKKLGKGIRLYKDIYAGSSFEWLQNVTSASAASLREEKPAEFQKEFLQGIPAQVWQRQKKPFTRNYSSSLHSNVRYIFVDSNEGQIMIGCCIMLRGVSARSIVEKYKKEFPGLKIHEKKIPQMKLIVMLSPKARIQVVLMPGNFVSILIADQKYVNLYRSIIQESARKSEQKALDF